MNDWLNLLFQGDYGGAAGGPETVAFIVLLSFAMGQFIGWVYMWTHRGLSYSQTFVASLVVIPVLVGVMMLLMAGSIVVAFGLLAVFAVVRFRNVLKDTRDTTFILWAIMQGLGVGTMRYSTSLIAAIGIAAILLYLRATAFGSRHRYDAVLSLRWTGAPGDGAAVIKDILRLHSSRVWLAEQRRSGEAGAEFSWRLLLRDPARSGELQTALCQTQGVENVSLFLREDESEI
jgi:hypothetical protein